MLFLRQTKKCRGIVVCSAIVLCWNTRLNTDVKQFSETVAIQLNVSSVIHKKAKSLSIFQFVKKMQTLLFFEQPNIPFSSLSVK